MGDLTVEQRIEQLEKWLGSMKRETIETDSKGAYFSNTSISNRSGQYLKIKDCPVCTHGTLQVFDDYHEQFYCLTCGHTLGKRIVAID